jgi:hydrogenase maturation protease
MRFKTNASMVMNAEKSCGTGTVLVLGLGNVLLKDEGVGVHIAGELQKQKLPGNVEVIDGGTASLDVLLLAGGIEKLVVIDALRAGEEAGTIYKAHLKTEERGKLQQIFSGNSRISLHQMGLLDALAAAERANCAPKKIVIIGVEPKKMDWGIELTDQVKQRVPEVIKKVLEEIEDAIHTK